MLEEAQAMPGQGTRSMFTCGLGMGVWLGVLAGVPAVLEQKTTICCKCLYLLASLKDSPQAAEVWKKTLFKGEIPR